MNYLFWRIFIGFSCAHIVCMHSLAYKVGLETISSDLVKKYGLDVSRVGLVTNQSGCDQKGISNVSILKTQGVSIITIFAPEHGFTGTVEAGKTVHNTIAASGIPIVSLYAHQEGLVGRTINSQVVENIDILLFDIQDCGMRHYTYISTLMRVLEAAATYKKKVLVLDRPNILGPAIEGPLVDSELISFISIAPIPLRYGLTIGELALYFNKYILKKPAELYIIPMQQYKRQPVTKLVAPLSPNIHTIQACYGYSFLGLLGEIRPFDVGVGTQYPFTCIMLPRSKKVPALFWQAVKQLLGQYHVKSWSYSTFNERKKEYCDGVRIEISDINKVRSFELFIKLLQLASKYMQLSYAPTFDKAIGTVQIRQMIHNNASMQLITKKYKDALRIFHKQAQPLFLYMPRPYIA
ncbi:MAG TPA: DUF1343 domain-containing protein [Candidatus Babeliales bacterium]|nr:DUF1343 domain-containing protein [Candidatus Babeliales bacterium]